MGLRLQGHFAAAARRFLNRETNFQRATRESAVVRWRYIIDDRLLQFVEHIRTARSAFTGGNRELANAGLGVDQDSVRGLTQVRLLAAHDEGTKMRLVPELALSGLPAVAAAIAKFLRANPRFLRAIGDAGERPACRAVVGLLGLAAFAHPAMQFIAVETIVTAIDQAGGRAVLERQHCHARPLGRPVAVEDTGPRARPAALPPP